MKFDNNTIALIGLLIIAFASLFAMPAISEKVITLIAGGIIGFMAKEKGSE